MIHTPRLCRFQKQWGWPVTLLLPFRWKQAPQMQADMQLKVPCSHPVPFGAHIRRTMYHVHVHMTRQAKRACRPASVAVPITIYHPSNFQLPSLTSSLSASHVACYLHATAPLTITSCASIPVDWRSTTRPSRRPHSRSPSACRHNQLNHASESGEDRLMVNGQVCWP